MDEKKLRPNPSTALRGSRVRAARQRQLAAATYAYTVTAVDAAGNASGPSNGVSVTVVPPPATDTTAPTVPTNLSATVVGSTVSLAWDISSDNTAVTGYTITRNGAVLATTNDTTFDNTGLAAGAYTVAAFDGAGNFSAEATAVTATVATPEGLTFLTSSALPDGVAGQAYPASIVHSDPPRPPTFRLVSGRVPDGTRFVRNTLANRPEARVTGTPSVSGTYSFAVAVKTTPGPRPAGRSASGCPPPPNGVFISLGPVCRKPRL